MRNDIAGPETESTTAMWEGLEGVVREKAQEFIQQILEEEVTELLGREKSERKAAVDAAPGYRNGYGKARRLSMSSGTITVRRPRVRGLEERFESRVLPLFARRTKEVGELIPELYLHGLAEGDFELALRGLLGEGAPLSKASIRRLRAVWSSEFEMWAKRSLADREVVYVWADGIYVKAGLERDKAALLVVMGAMRDGTKEVLAVTSGYRESTDSWAEVCRGLKARGLAAPKLLMADGNAAIWGAARTVWPEAGEQRCWNHKMRNVLDRLPQREQSEAKELLRTVVYAATRAAALKARQAFGKRYGPWYPKAVTVLEDDWDRMVTFYDFPEAHWKHLRTTNVVESPSNAPTSPGFLHASASFRIRSRYSTLNRRRVTFAGTSGSGAVARDVVMGPEAPEEGCLTDYWRGGKRPPDRTCDSKLLTM